MGEEELPRGTGAAENTSSGMICPYCGGKMASGKIYCNQYDLLVYWLPSEIDIRALDVFGRTPILKAGGVLIDQPRKIGFMSKKKPVSYHCPTCHLLITAYQEFPP